jgi:hypothetical protein
VRSPVPPCTFADALLGKGISPHNGHSSTPNGLIFTQDATHVPHCPISSDLLLLDSQSTIHFSHNPTTSTISVLLLLLFKSIATRILWR